MMKIIDMSVSREPNWLQADREIARWKEEGYHTLVRLWRSAKKESLNLREQIINTLETEGVCQLYWKGTSENLNSYYARLWAEVMPEYDFEIDVNYKCIVSKKAK